jgi:hypothetical protein
MSGANTTPPRRPEAVVKLSPVQIRYLAAEEARKLITAEVYAAFPVPGDDATEAEVESWLDKQAALEMALGLSKAERAVAEAEAALIAWMIAEVRPVALRQGGDAIDVFDFLIARSARDYSTRKKVVALAMKLGTLA